MNVDVFREGNVAVVTGAALGIGRAACMRFAELGMSVCLADLAGEDLEAAFDSVVAASPRGTDGVLVHPTDVSDFSQIEALQQAVNARFGAPHLLMNNAVTRIGRGGPIDLAVWRQALDVNFWGVVQGVEAFLPGMQALDAPARIINVGSKQGITNPPGNTIYNVSKAALKSYTESLQHALRNDERNSGNNAVTAHLLIPGWTTTGKNEHKAGAWLPRQVVDFMIDAVAARSFYILCPDDEVSVEMDHKRIQWAAGDIIENRPPLSRWHPALKDAAAKACN